VAPELGKKKASRPSQYFLEVRHGQKWDRETTPQSKKLVKNKKKQNTLEGEK